MNKLYVKIAAFILGLHSVLPAAAIYTLDDCLRIARESIFTGLNNFMCYSVSDADYADKFGFTEAEVDALLAQAGLTEKKAAITEWYDGYRFGDGTEIYCPWDILAHIVRLQKNPDAAPQAYWKNTSSNAIVRTLVRQAGPDTRDKIGTLISGGSIAECLVEELTYDTVYKNERNIWSMLYLTGYLTKASAQPANGATALTIPNKEVRTIFQDTVTLWFEDSLDTNALTLLVATLWDGDAPAVQKMLCDMLYDTISYFDSAESFYHSFMTGILKGAGLVVRTNRENGLGRSDILIEDGKNRRAMIFELKRAATYAELDAKASEALAQIAEKKYSTGLPPQITKVLEYGLAFWEKECRVTLASKEIVL